MPADHRRRRPIAAIVSLRLPRALRPDHRPNPRLPRGFRDVRLTEVFVQRSKDREDPGNPRNYKRMVPIQYQETVHCLAFVLHIVAALKGSLAAALAGGVKIAGSSDPYAPPNPDLYPTVVDGRCRFLASLGDVRVEGYTDFKRGSPWAKRRVLRGTGDGKLFEIEVSYLEGWKFLRIDGAARTVRSHIQFLRARPRHRDRLGPTARPRPTDGGAFPEPSVRPRGLPAFGRALEGLPRPDGEDVHIPGGSAIVGCVLWERSDTTRMAGVNVSR